MSRRSSLFREVIPQINDRLSFDGGVHFGEPNYGTDCGSIRCRRQAALELDRDAAILKGDHQQVLQRIGRHAHHGPSEERRAAPMLNVLGIPEMTWFLLLSPAQF